jgi:acyl-CoA dehydrogenase
MSTTADRAAELRGLIGALEPWLAEHGESTRALAHAGSRPAPAVEYLRATLAYHAALFETGWLGRGWAPEFGGTGGDAITRAAVYDVLGQVGFPMPSTVNSVEVLAPSLVHYAPDLAERFLPGLIAGTEAWCQGFSEPEAGSDLASLRMRAVPDGDEWVLNGQKTWSTRAYGSARCVALVRTGTQESRHRGLTMMLVDMDAPGVVCRPINEMSGTQHFGEIFFEDVRVGSDRIIGAVDGAWEVAQHALQWERGMFGWVRQAAMHDVLRRVDLARTPEVAPALGAAFQDVTALRLRSFATIEALNAGASSGPQVSIDKLLLSQAERSVQDVANAAAPVAVDDGNPDWDERVHDFLHSRSAPIYGGSAEIQRTIIANSVLELRTGGRK